MSNIHARGRYFFNLVIFGKYCIGVCSITKNASDYFYKLTIIDVRAKVNLINCKNNKSTNDYKTIYHRLTEQ